jgi:hypothetical protein
MAGCCIALTGITRDCDNSVGGIRRAWGACFDDVQSPTVTDGMITAIIGGATAWSLYEFRKETGSATSTFTRDDATGSLYYSTDIVFQFSKLETSKRIEINAIAQSDTAWIIEDNNGRFWYFGYFSPVTLSDGTAETGTAFADFNGYNVTLNDLSRELPYEVSATAAATLPGVSPSA